MSASPPSPPDPGRKGSYPRAGPSLIPAGRSRVRPCIPRYSVTDLGAIHDALNGAGALNEFGSLVGSAAFAASGDTHAFLFDGGQITHLGTLPGGPSSFAADLNDFHQAVGRSHLGGDNAVTHAFLYGGRQIVDLGTLGGLSSLASAINNRGEIVGWSNVAWHSTLTRAFLAGDEGMSDLGALVDGEEASSAALDINDRGEVVGHATAPDGKARAFLYADETMTDLGNLPGFASSIAQSINAAGEVAGFALQVEEFPARIRSFRFRRGEMRDLGTLGGAKTIANKINILGQVVGTANLPGDRTRSAFFVCGEHEGEMPTDLNTRVPAGFDWALVEAVDINDAGQIVVRGVRGEAWRRFLLSPSPGQMLANLSAKIDRLTEAELLGVEARDTLRRELEGAARWPDPEGPLTDAPQIRAMSDGLETFIYSLQSLITATGLDPAPGQSLIGTTQAILDHVSRVRAQGSTLEAEAGDE